MFRAALLRVANRSVPFLVIEVNESLFKIDLVRGYRMIGCSTPLPQVP
jgi:hypothetical protein